nr:FkbM family methyltransferase [Neoroseomonas alkaliterrae]
MSKVKRKLAEFMRYQAELGSRGPEVMSRLDALASAVAQLQPPPSSAPTGPSGAESFSQCGEDRLVAFILRIAGHEGPVRYADIGAAHPVYDNNTYLFRKAGGSGLLVEADPDYLPEYRHHRPGDAVEQVAVVPERLAHQDSITFYAMEDRGWSSISPEHSALAEALGKGGVRREFSVRCATINTLLGRHFADGRIDLLSLDVEGLDAELLGELDFGRFAPKVIIVENDAEDCATGRAAASTVEMMRGKGYVFFGYTFVNTIYASRALLEAARF